VAFKIKEKQMRQMLRKAIISAFLITLGLTSGYAQFKPIKFIQDSLPNGLQVIYCIDRTAPVVATVVHYRVGSKDELPSQMGYAHFFEHLMFEATSDIPRASMDKYVQEASGTLNAHTSFDETVYHFLVPSNEIKLALWMESQRMRQLKVDTIGVETQRGVVLEEMKMRTLNQAYGTLLQKFCKNLFAGSSYEWETIGSDENIRNAKIIDFRNFYNNFYQPNNATLVIAGDFDLAQAKEYVNTYFSIYPRGAEPKRGEFKLSALDSGYDEVIVDEKVQLPGTFICFRGPALNDPDYYALSLLTDILAAGNSSRMYQRLVDKDQIAVQAAVEPFSLEKSGAILLIGIAAPGKSLKKVEATMMDEVKKVIEKGITLEELTKAKNIKEAGFVEGNKNVLNKAQSLAKYYSYYRNANLINTEIDKYMKVTLEDVARVAKKYLGTDKTVVLNYVPKGFKDAE
jgi:predicted Zn-dependent peptidase